MSLRSNTIMFHKTGMNETEHKRTVSEVPRHSWMKKMAIALGIILLASVSLNVMLWFETLEEVHTNISSVREELKQMGLWVRAFRESHGRLPSAREQVQYGMKEGRYEGLDMEVFEEDDGIQISFEMKDKYKGKYDVSGHRIVFDKELLKKWRREAEE